MVDKAANYTTYKKITREDLGESAKYIAITATDKNGKRIKPVASINQAKIDEDLRYAGYNLMVTSALRSHILMHVLLTCKKKETIYGHFLICYLSLFLLRIMEIKCFHSKVNFYDLINFIRDFRIVDNRNGFYINIPRNQFVNEKIKEVTGLTNLDALSLKQKFKTSWIIACCWMIQSTRF